MGSRTFLFTKVIVTLFQNSKFKIQNWSLRACFCLNQRCSIIDLRLAWRVLMLSRYKIYRGTTSGALTLLAEMNTSQHFGDNTVSQSIYYYEDGYKR